MLAGRVPPPLVALAGDRLLGYVVLRLTPQVGSGELDFLAVVEDARGRGIGWRLAAAGRCAASARPRRSATLATDEPIVIDGRAPG